MTITSVNWNANKTNRLVLAVAPNNNHRETIRKALAAGNYEVSFISSLNDVMAAIQDFQPAALVHDWTATDGTQARRFHFQAVKKATFSTLPRIILVGEVTPSMLAFASDTLVDKVMSLGTACLSLANQIDMIHASNQSLGEIKTWLRKLRCDQASYDQDELDREIRDAYRQYPHDNRVKIEFGNLKLRLGESDEAGTLAREVLRREPRNLRAMNLLARVHMKLDDWDRATEILRTAHELSPLNPERLLLLGDAYYGQGELDQALVFYEQAKVADPDLTRQANQGIGQIKLAQGQLEEALSIISGSASEEEAAGYFNNSAVFSVRQGDLDQALRLYETALKALRSDRLKPTIYNNIALTYRRMGRTDDAEKYLQRSLRLDERNPKTLKQIESLQKIKLVGRKPD
jgi:tetratricopeptide (TPR) repeat protein